MSAKGKRQAGTAGTRELLATRVTFRSSMASAVEGDGDVSRPEGMEVVVSHHGRSWVGRAP